MTETRQQTPPQFVVIPAGLLYSMELPAQVIVTAARIWGLGWRHQYQYTDPITMDELCQIVGLERSQVYDHLSLLRSNGVLRYATVSGTIRFTLSAQMGLLLGRANPENRTPSPENRTPSPENRTPSPENRTRDAQHVVVSVLSLQQKERQQQDCCSRAGTNGPDSASEMMPNAEGLWRAAVAQLRLQLAPETIETLLAGSRAAAVAGGLVIYVSNAGACEWLEARLRPMIERTLARVAGAPVAVRFAPASAAPAPRAVVTHEKPPVHESGESDTSPDLVETLRQYLAPEVAERLAGEFPERVERQVRHYELARRQGRATSPGWLVRAIREDWRVPAEAR